MPANCAISWWEDWGFYGISVPGVPHPSIHPPITTDHDIQPSAQKASWTLISGIVSFRCSNGWGSSNSLCFSSSVLHKSSLFRFKSTLKAERFRRTAGIVPLCSAACNITDEGARRAGKIEHRKIYLCLHYSKWNFASDLSLWMLHALPFRDFWIIDLSTRAQIRCEN